MDELVPHIETDCLHCRTDCKNQTTVAADRQQKFRTYQTEVEHEGNHNKVKEMRL